jgi:hypothetical protein
MEASQCQPCKPRAPPRHAGAAASGGATSPQNLCGCSEAFVDQRSDYNPQIQFLSKVELLRAVDVTEANARSGPPLRPFNGKHGALGAIKLPKEKWIWPEERGGTSSSAAGWRPATPATATG